MVVDNGQEGGCHNEEERDDGFTYIIVVENNLYSVELKIKYE